MFIPPKFAQKNAQKALACLAKGSDAMTPVGRKRARELAQGKPLTIQDLKEINSFRRHKNNAKFTGDLCKDKGAVAWLGWGNGFMKNTPIASASNWAKRKYK